MGFKIEITDADTYLGNKYYFNLEYEYINDEIKIQSDFNHRLQWKGLDNRISFLNLERSRFQG